MGEMRVLRCQGCGGNIEFQEGQGFFKCRFCGSVYESEAGSVGTVRAIKIVEQRLENIEAHTQAAAVYAQTTAGISTEERLQKLAQQIQDKIDYLYIAFDNSFGRKAGSLAIIAWILGAVLFFIGLASSDARVFGILIGLLLIGGGVGLFFYYQKKKKAYEAQAQAIYASELSPIYEQLRSIGAVLPGGAVSVGYMESTQVPQRYCVICHQNVMPVKGAGGSHGLFHGTNLLLTIMTCGLWIPAWLIMTALMKTGSAARRAIRSGSCPMCGTTTLFPARIPNTQVGV